MDTNRSLMGCFAILALTAGIAGCGDSETTAATTSGTPDEKVYTDACAGQTSGTVCTWLGTKGEEGFNGDGLPRYATRLNSVQDLLFHPDGTVWFTDFNNYLVRRVLADGTVESVVGWTDPIFPGDGPPGGPKPEGADGSVWQLNHPTNLILAPDDTVLLVAWHNHKILRIDPNTRNVKVVAGGGAGFAGDGGPIAKTLFKQPSDATIDEDGNIYVVDQQNQRVRMIGADGNMSTIAGKGTAGDSGDGGLAIEAEFSWEVGSNPNPSGGILYADGKLYISDTENNRVRVMDLATGMVDAFAGTGEIGFSGDGGDAKSAKLRAPRDLELGPDGDIYIADTDNAVIRAVSLADGKIRTVVGTGELGVDDMEQMPATEAMLRRPFGIAFDNDGNLYVTDSLNNRVVKVAK